MSTLHHLTPLAEQVAKHLPGNWVVKPTHENNPEDRYPPSCPCLSREDGVRLCLEQDHKGKLNISHFRPFNSGPGPAFVEVYSDVNPGEKVSATAILVSASKSAEQIAKDIIRRLLPDAERVTKLVLEKLSRNKQEEADRLDILHKLAEASGAKVKYFQDYDREKGYTPRLHEPHYDLSVPPDTGKWSKGYGSIEVRSSTCIEIKLSSVKPDTALKIAAFLKEVFQ